MDKFGKLSLFQRSMRIYVLAMRNSLRDIVFGDDAQIRMRATRDGLILT